MRDRDRSAIHSIRGPVMVITVGVLFALQNFTPYSFGETWPVLIIVAGLVSLLGRAVGPPPPTAPPPPPFSTYQPPQPPPPPAGGYRQTPYAQASDPGSAGNRPGNPGGAL
jgi:Domain of unknown function (DUF5668)